MEKGDSSEEARRRPLSVFEMAFRQLIELLDGLVAEIRIGSPQGARYGRTANRMKPFTHSFSPNTFEY